VPGILCKQDYDGRKDVLSPPGEGRPNISHYSQKLPQYFQAYTIYMVTQYPIQAMFQKSDFIGWISKWGAKIGALNVK
jgi:predicted flavoprotein YhiN